ncbi:hypothetical protein BAE44_0022169 [Dichanthelium oligosanthes]|uniref:Uncharacterized protein n=1 Tax=Dichanthelium oligosanthes TaxID=888268 RepID=A0A1E5UVA8_9POAL|nr:hypothetical protein BAE44_0022169 [Dichanthelium oligosanthes]
MPSRVPKDGEISPSRPLDARETSVTYPFALQVMPSHVQQSVPFFHDAARPPSCESPARNRSRELRSCSVHELDRESSSMMAKLNEGMARLLPWFLAILRLRDQLATSVLGRYLESFCLLLLGLLALWGLHRCYCCASYCWAVLVKCAGLLLALGPCTPALEPAGLTGKADPKLGRAADGPRALLGWSPLRLGLARLLGCCCAKCAAGWLCCRLRR